MHVYIGRKVTLIKKFSLKSFMINGSKSLKGQSRGKKSDVFIVFKTSWHLAFMMDSLNLNPIVQMYIYLVIFILGNFPSG